MPKENVSGLYLMQLPPPVHGASIANKNIANYLHRAGLPHYLLNISLASGNSNLGQLDFKKILLFFPLAFRVLFNSFGKHYIYITLSPHGGAFFKDAILLLVAKMLIKDRFVHFHGKGVHDFVKKSTLLKWFYRLVLRNCKIIHLDKVLLADLNDVISDNKTFILCNGVEDEFSSCFSASKELSKDIDILYLSNMKVSKGWKLLLKALANSQISALNLNVVFAGNFESKDDARYFDKFIQDNGLSNVKYFGPAYGDDKVELLSRTKVFALPTFYKNECAPLSILEALSAGCFILSTTEGAIPSLVTNETSILLDAPSEASLVNGIIESVKRQNSDSDSLIAISREHYLQYFQLKTHLVNFQEIVFGS